MYYIQVGVQYTYFSKPLQWNGNGDYGVWSPDNYEALFVCPLLTDVPYSHLFFDLFVCMIMTLHQSHQSCISTLVRVEILL